MKKLFSLLAVLLMVAASPVQALVDDLKSSDVAVLSNTASSQISTDKWYVLYNAGRKVYTYGTAYQTSTAPKNVATVSNTSPYMLRFVDSGTEGQYYIQNANGEYFKPLANSTYTGVTSEKSQAATFTMGTINGQAGHWWLKVTNGLVMDSDGNSVVGYGTNLPTDIGVNKDYIIYEITVSSPDALTGGAEALYHVDKGGLFRIRNHRTSDKYVNEDTNTNKGNATTKNTTETQRMSQMWIVEGNDNGYSLRNAQTGNYLQADYTCTPSKYYWTITLSPNNTSIDDPYLIICHGEVKSGTRNCLNIASGGTTLTDWSYNGDAGSEWLFEAVESAEVDTATVRDNLDKICATGSIDLSKGIYYTFTNLDNGYLLSERPADNVLITTKDNETNWSQYWQVAYDEDKGIYTLQNVFSSRFINRKASTASSAAKGNYSTTTANTVNREWIIQPGAYAWESTYNFVEVLKPETGIGVSNNVSVNDDINATSSQWVIHRVDLTDEQLAQAKQEYEEYNFINNTSTSVLNNRLQKFFNDYSCTTLKDEYKEMSDEELINAMTAEDLPSLIYNIALKVKNDSWGHREKEFRIYDYKIYSDPIQWASNSLMGTNYFSPQSGPTGISVKQGDLILFFVGANPVASTTLKFSNNKDFEINPTQTELKRGINVYVAPDNGFLFIHHILTNTNRYLADFDPITIHIEGGRVQGYFDITRGHTNADWKDFTANLFQDEVVHLKSRHYQYNMHYDGLLRQITTKELDEVDTDGIAKGIEGTLHRWDQLVDNEMSIMSIEQFEGRFNCVFSASSNSDGNPYASSYGTWYPGVGTIMNYTAMTHGKEYDEGANYWCIAHETGHCLQKLIKLTGTTEVSNNLLSQIATWMQGSNVSRYMPWSTSRDFFADNTFWVGRDIGTMSRMYFQLWLYFHLQGHDDRFYPKVFDMFRKSPIVNSTNPNNPGSGTTDYLKFAKFCCDAAEADLSEFFQFWGFFVPVSNYHIGDYADYYMTTTQKEIDDAIAYMQKYPKKLGNILFIDDRIKKYPAGYPGMPRGATRLATTTGVTPGNTAQMGELGMFTDFVDNATQRTYGCNINTESKQVIVNSATGKGAVGFKVYNADRKLIYASNTYTFTLPDAIFNSDFYIVAAYGDGTDMLIYDPKDLSAVNSSVVAGDTETIFNPALPAFDLNGQRVFELQHGQIYSQNGVKVKY